MRHIILLIWEKICGIQMLLTERHTKISVKSSVLKSLEDMILLEKHMEDYDVSITDEDKAMIKETTQQFLNDNSLDDKNLVSGNEKTVNRALTLMAVQQKMRTAIQAGADTEVSDEEAAQKSMDYVFISYQTKDDSGNSKDVSDDEKVAVKVSGRGDCFRSEGRWRFERACRRARGNGSDTDV